MACRYFAMHLSANDRGVLQFRSFRSNFQMDNYDKKISFSSRGWDGGFLNIRTEFTVECVTGFSFVFLVLTDIFSNLKSRFFCKLNFKSEICLFYLILSKFMFISLLFVSFGIYRFIFCKTYWPHSPFHSNHE